MTIKLKLIFIVLLIFTDSLFADPFETKIEFNKSEFLLFEQMILTVTFKNVSLKDIAVSERLLALEYREYGFRFIHNKDKHYKATIITPRCDSFVIIPAGKYIKRIYDVSLDGNLPIGNEAWQAWITVEHMIMDEYMDKYEQFAGKHEAETWNGSSKSNIVEIKFVSPQNAEQWILYDEWIKREEEQTDIIDPFPTELCLNHETELMNKFPNHPILDYWFWYKNKFTSSWGPVSLYYTGTFTSDEDKKSTEQRLEEYIKTVDTIIARRNGDKSFDSLKEQLLWNKLTALSALGRDLEAEALKGKLISQEPDRIYDSELKIYETRASELKKLLTDMKASEVVQRPKENITNNEKEGAVEGDANSNQSNNEIPVTGKIHVTKQKNEDNHKQDTGDINNQSNKPELLNPLALISILILIVIAGILVIIVIRKRLSRS